MPTLVDCFGVLIDVVFDFQVQCLNEQSTRTLAGNLVQTQLEIFAILGSRCYQLHHSGISSFSVVVTGLVSSPTRLCRYVSLVTHPQLSKISRLSSPPS
jgi:hypothetical protein